MKTGPLILALYAFLSTVELARCENRPASRPGLQQGVLIADSARFFEPEIRRAALLALRSSNLNLNQWSVALSRIRVEGKFTPEECNNHHPSGCTIAYIGSQSGDPYAVIWFVKGSPDLRRVLLHEFRHALAYVTGDAGWREKGHRQ